jgi:Inner membrane component of T3SS, cytoplasmic domain
MSFRLFIWYCMLVGAWAAFLGWGLARMLSPGNDIAQAAVYGLFLGLTVAFGLSLVDALWNFSPSQFVAIFLRVATAMAVGLFGSSACGGLAGTIYHNLAGVSFGPLLGGIVFILSWVALGLLVGVSVSVFDLLAGFARKDVRGPLRKLIKCSAGGTVGGIIGGIMAWLLRFQVGALLGDASGNDLWSPTAIGFVVLGGLIGLLVGASQVLLMEAWVKVEAGFRPGRDLILTRDRTVIGRAEGSDIALFGDSGVDKQHAAIVQERGGYFLEPVAPTTFPTFVNDQPITARTPLRAGDLIRVGKSLLRFNQRRKK